MFQMDPSAIRSILDDLGRKRDAVESYEESTLRPSSGSVAVDEHVVPSSSGGNGFAEPGYKASKLKFDQVNVLVAYDTGTEYPLCTKVFRSSSVDNQVSASSSLTTISRVPFSLSTAVSSHRTISLCSQRTGTPSSFQSHRARVISREKSKTSH